MTATERDRETAHRIAVVVGRRVLADGPDGEVDPGPLVADISELVTQLCIEAAAAERARVLGPIQALAKEWDVRDDARLGINRIAKTAAARALRAAIEEASQ